MYDRVFVHAGEMEKRGQEYKFLSEDEHGFLHGEIRAKAIKVLMRQRKVKDVIIVGGPTKDGISKAQLIKAMISEKVIPLESIRSTEGNINAIKTYLLDKKEGINGLLTNFYHLPRALRLISENGAKLVPICAEAVLLTDNFLYWSKKIQEWYGQPSMLKRILSEIQGLSHIEQGKYTSPYKEGKA